MAQILNRTPLAGISFEDGNGSHIRIYYQDRDGVIKETYYDEGIGWNLRDQDNIGQAKLNTGIAAVTWNNGTEIRVYFIAPDNQIVERVYSGGAAGDWSDGALTTGKTKFYAAPYSNLAALGYGVGSDTLKVYYQDTNMQLREIILDGANDIWNDGTHELPIAVAGSSLAAASLKARQGTIWLYYQEIDLTLSEYIYEESWHQGAFSAYGVFSPGAYLSTVMAGNIRILVFAINDDNRLTVTLNDNDEWQGTTDIDVGITFSAVTSIRGTSNDLLEMIRVYYQPLGNTIAEYGSDNGDPGSWVQLSSNIPTR